MLFFFFFFKLLPQMFCRKIKINIFDKYIIEKINIFWWCYMILISKPNIQIFFQNRTELLTSYAMTRVSFGGGGLAGYANLEFIIIGLTLRLWWPSVLTSLFYLLIRHIFGSKRKPAVLERARKKRVIRICLPSLLSKSEITHVC